MPNFIKLACFICKLYKSFLFWGCPALRAGRAVSQLAGLLGPAQKSCAFLLALRLRRPAFHPSARGGWNSRR
ncbi:hypothetical protein SGRA_2616 [Saprospira grandis str. Lewin]|uniref:Uncharacterized protein n=1 Tax=Saprospira grandis (strain Lewin) TaxID=984262 RepID=H6L816_SAPGL|nr:hypothetical protein SGRA_2616 [Saprospira grandis str. Lewin]